MPAAWAPERLEPRLTLAADLLSIAAARPEAPGFPPYPPLPIPAGATLIDVSDSGQQLLFSSPDPNIVPGQQTVPFLPGAVGNLFWMDLSADPEPVIRLVTHIAGSTTVSAGYTGIGTGIIDPFIPGTADLSGDGQSVVFDSRINAHTFDVTVPPENDQPSNARLVIQIFPGQPPQAITVEDGGSIDVFVWHASAADPANNITAVSLLNAAGKQAAIGQAAEYLFPVPDPTKPMMAGIFPEQPPLGFSPGFDLLEPSSSEMASHGISDDGRTILYSTNVPAPWLDTVNTSPAIADDIDPLVGEGWSVDGFVVQGADAVSAAALEASGRTLTATKYQDAGGPRALGSYENQIPWQLGFLPSASFYPEYLQLSSQGNRVVYSTRVPSSVIVPQSTDADFSLDVFAYDIAADTTILVTTQAGQPTVAAGAGQSPFPVEQPGLLFSTLELFDSQNHSVSRDGWTVAVTSSAGNLVNGFVDNNVEFRPFGFIFGVPVPGPGPVPGPAVRIQQQAATDIYAVRPDSRTTFLLNTPNGLANTNLNATFGGMSADGSTFLFGTAANNFYDPPFASPPFPPFATGPLPPNFILGGFENLWSRQVDEATTTLVSVGWANTASGNRPTLAAEVLPGSRDLLPNVSESGRFVMFATASNNIVPGINDRIFKGGVFVRDMQSGQATLVSTTATGNVPSAGTFLEYALAADENPAGTFRVFLGGAGGGDMQSRFRPEDLPPRDSHIYFLDFPVATAASSATNRDLFSISGGGPFGRNIVEYRGLQGTIKASPGSLLPGYSGTWTTATGDVTGDGVADYVYGAGPGGYDTVIVIDGRTNAEVMRFEAFSAIPDGGVFVATGDVDRDGYADVIVGTQGPRPAQVRVFSGRRGTLLADFFVFEDSVLEAVDVPAGESLTQAQAGYPLFTGATPVEKTGTGTLVLDTANTLFSTLAVNAGTAVAADPQALGAATLDVAAGATLAISPVVGAANAVQVAGLGTIAGRIDVGTGRFALPASGESPEAKLRSLLIAGRSGGGWDGAGGILSGDAPSAGDTAGFAVGYRVADDNSATVAWASLGDADLDGTVTTADVNAILTSGLLNTGTPGATWQQGDFDYDGLLTTADINAMLTTGRLNTGSYLPTIPVSLGPVSSRIDTQASTATAQQSLEPAIGGLQVAVRVAGGDVNGDGFADVIVASGEGVAPRVEVYSGKLLTQAAANARIASFAVSSTPGAGWNGNGAFVAAADMNRDGRSEIVVSFDGSPSVSVVNPLDGGVLSSVDLTTLMGGAMFGQGARIAARAGRIAIATGPGVAPSARVLAFEMIGMQGVWSIEPLTLPELGAIGTNGLFIG